MNDEALTVEFAQGEPAKYVWLAIPSYTGQVHLATMRSLLVDALGLIEHGWRFSLIDESGNALIAHCRAIMLAQFLASDATDIVMIDFDVAWEQGALVSLLERKADFVAGVYPHRVDPESYSVRWLPDADGRGLVARNPETGEPQNGGLIEVEGVPAGFLRLSRKAVQAIVDANPDLRFASPPSPNGEAWAVFDSHKEPDHGAYWGEDFSFCKRYRDTGGSVWMDPELKLHHVGYKTFSGKIGDWLKAGKWKTGE
jgi:hypothetical protein